MSFSSATSDKDQWRGGVYSLISFLLTTELSPEDIVKVRRIFEDSGFHDLAEALNYGEEHYISLKVDFTRTFILNVHLYESVFRDPTGLLCTDLSVEVKRFYARLGYEPDLASARVRCFDHLGIESAFMAELIRLGKRDLQLKFLEEHLARWGPLAGLAIAWNASTEFYRGLGLLIAHFILEDYVHLKFGGYVEA
ncbi:MAG: molecular chaperone TorD family protein [Thermoprotei archaeon]|nr:molecular chaperone TorD family protein [Thermoprotei archaeon]